jgi:hypothetical protein
MKAGFGIVLAFINVIALSMMAQEVAQDQGWGVLGMACAWVLGAILGLIPVIRSVALLILCFVYFPFLKALWVGPLFVAGLKFLELVGVAMLKSPNK